MKNYLFVLMLLILFSCDRTDLEPQRSQPLQETEVLERIRSLGFLDQDIEDLGSYYLVQGDIHFDKISSVDDENGRKEQASTTALISLNNQSEISVRVDTSIPSSGTDNWRTEIEQALNDWNAVPHCKIRFEITTSATADISITSDNGALPNNVIADAQFPGSGQPGNTIRINLDFNSNMNVSTGQKRHNMAHELGHCIGFRHTNWQGRGESAFPEGANTIPGTPTSDANSVMNGGTALNSWAGLSEHDIVGARTLYPAFFYIIQNSVLHSVHPITSDYTLLGGSIWSSTEGMTSLNSFLYVVQNTTLWRVDPENGTRVQLGSSGAWAGTEAMTAYDDRLYIVQDTKLWRVNPTDGSYVSISAEGTWAGTMAMTTYGDFLFIVQDDNLYRVNPADGTYTQLGASSAWFDTDVMATLNGWLYIVQDNSLWKVSPVDGSYTQIGTPGAWGDSEGMAAQDDVVFIVQDAKIWKADPSTGAHTQFNAANWAGTQGMTSIF